MSDKKPSRPQLPVVGVYDQQDPDTFGLDPETMDPDRHYRYARLDSQRLARLMSRGYRIETRSDGVKMKADLGQGATEDQIRVGDLVLVSCKKEVADHRTRQLDGLRRSRLEIPEGQFRKKASAKNIKVTDKED